MNTFRRIFAEYLAGFLIRKITVGQEDRVVGDYNPDSRYFVGRLSAVKDEKSSRYASISPTQMGLEVIINQSSALAAEFEVCLSADFFLRVNPVYKEQCSYFVEQFNKNFPDEDVRSIEDIKSYLQLNPGKNFSTSVTPVFQKVSIENTKFTVAVKDILAPGRMNGKKVLDNVSEKILDVLLEKAKVLPDHYGVINDPVFIANLYTAHSWEEFIERNAGVVKSINWDFTLICEAKEYKGDKIRIGIYMLNTAEQGKDPDRINTIFNVSMMVKAVNTELIPVELNYFNDDYKYDRTEPGIGRNCSVEKVSMNEVKTVSVPVYRQFRLITDQEKASAKFKTLIDTPSEVLNNIADKMKEEFDRWKDDIRTRPNLTVKARRQFQEEIDDFAKEIQRFEYGIEVLQKYPDTLRAFRLMNQAMLESSKGYEEWYLFQIVFIVSIIPDIVVREYPEVVSAEEADIVDLLYFPTGGGKTEAYLGTLVFAMFFDRIRGKNAGVTGIVKFPLRLLSLQQLQRNADLIAKAEIIRRSQVDLANADGFSIGYFVGSGNTLNHFVDDSDEESWDLIPKIAALPQVERDEKYLIVDNCPFCGEKSVLVDVLVEERRLIHCCKNDECSEDILPIYVVDKEIYRYLPTVIVSTLDKTALIGLQRNFRNILGAVPLRCPVHGFTSQSDCVEGKACQVDKGSFAIVNIYDAAPSIIVQDELHLVRESLGAFNSHYETFMNYFLKNLSSSQKPIKVIAATATITHYEEQIYHLYHREARMFPTTSPYRKRSFYSFVDEEDLNRIIIGITPNDKTTIFSIQDIIEHYRTEVFRLWDKPCEMRKIPGMEKLSDDECKAIVKDYWVILEYNQTLRDSMQIIQSVDNMVNDNLRHKDVPQIATKSMTGDDTFSEIRNVLSEIEHPASGDLPNIDLISATSMISHGVDASAFNFMIFFGIPKNTSEYIQAYSRAGRKYPAIILMVFNANREKDSSFGRNFVKFNDYKDILVEPVPINRWANKAVGKTLPGLFSALVLNHYDIVIGGPYNVKLYMLSGFQRAWNEGMLPSMEEIIAVLCGAYGADVDDLGAFYKTEISNIMHQIIERLLHIECSTKNDFYLPKALEKVGYPVMRSLRYTEDPITIEMREPDADMARKVRF